MLALWVVGRDHRPLRGPDPGRALGRLAPVGRRVRHLPRGLRPLARVPGGLDLVPVRVLGADRGGGLGGLELPPRAVGPGSTGPVRVVGQARPSASAWPSSGSRRSTPRAEGGRSSSRGSVTVLELVFLVAFVAAGLVSRLGATSPTSMIGPPIDSRPARSTCCSPSSISLTATRAGTPPRTWPARSATPLARLPRAILLGTGLVTALYLALNLVYALALPAAEIRRIAGQRRGPPTRSTPSPGSRRSRLFGPAWADPALDRRRPDPALDPERLPA